MTEQNNAVAKSFKEVQETATTYYTLLEKKASGNILQEEEEELNKLIALWDKAINKTDEYSADIFDKSEALDDDYETYHLIDKYTKAISDIDKRITVKMFTGNTNDRDAILNDFSEGKMQVLTSMKCLDEGIDVPRSELAIFCASTGNPRQFIQRRGRILRTHKDKEIAIIHDLVVIPKIEYGSPSFRMEQSLLVSELKRVKDFATLSENMSYAQLELLDVMNYYGLNLFNNDHIL